MQVHEEKTRRPKREVQSESSILANIGGVFGSLVTGTAKAVGSIGLAIPNILMRRAITSMIHASPPKKVLSYVNILIRDCIFY